MSSPEDRYDKLFDGVQSFREKVLERLASINVDNTYTQRELNRQRDEIKEINRQIAQDRVELKNDIILAIEEKDIKITALIGDLKDEVVKNKQDKDAEIKEINRDINKSKGGLYVFMALGAANLVAAIYKYFTGDFK